MKLYQSADKSVIEFEENNAPSYVLRSEKDFISDKILEEGQWEERIINEAKKFLSDSSNILDLGANIGVWSIALSKTSPRGQIFAFEPQSETYKQLCANLFINGCKNVIPHRFGLGTRKQSGKTLTMQINPENNGASKIVSDEKSENSEIQKIDIKSLSDFDFPKIRLIKMDVEGFELNVLNGGEQLIKRDKPVIFFEAWEKNQKEMFQWFEKRGYIITKLGDSDFYAQHSSEIHARAELHVKARRRVNPCLWWLWVSLAVIGVVSITGAICLSVSSTKKSDT
jgi:FkbM family methyltransferase